MLNNNHVWLRVTPFVTVSYPDIAQAMIKAIVLGGKTGITRAEIIRGCAKYKTANIRLTLSQLERAAVVVANGFGFTIVQSDKFRNSIIDKFNSTESRVLQALYTSPSLVSTADIADRYMIDRAQIQPAAKRLGSRGYITIHQTGSESKKHRLHYSLSDLSTKTIGTLLNDAKS